MDKICVVGLGLIGGSVAMSLKRAGYKVDGFNRSRAAVDYALKNNIIDGVAEDFTAYDFVVVALPPKPCVEFILKTTFKKDAIVSDICGVKKFVEDAVYVAKPQLKYIGLHPMAGKEVSGVENACADLFDRASMVITRGICTDECAINTVKKLVKEMGFKRIVECSAELHDAKIAYTSQLAHVVSNCYVNDPEIEGCLGFTGGSFQDMTRIAGVDEKVWSELYLLNADNLLQKTVNLYDSLGKFITALKSAKESGDVAALRDNLSVGANAYRNGKANGFTGEGISVTELKYILRTERIAEGESTFTEVPAVARFSDGAVIFFYSYDGAEYRLFVSPDRMVHIRNGETRIHMIFSEGEKTYCHIKSEAGNGGFYVFTDELKVALGNGACSVKCSYSDSDGGARTVLTVSARQAD